MTTYLSISMNGLARITPATNKKFCGLGTHNLKTCVAAFIFNSQGMSVIHVDIATDLDSILVEAKTLGKNSKIILVKNESGQARANARHWLLQRGIEDNIDLCDIISDYLKEHLPAVTPTIIDSPTGSAYLDRNGKLTLEPDKLTANILYSPQTRLRYAVQYLNMIFLKKMRPACLEFDGINFVEIPMLCDQAKLIAGTIRPYLRDKNLDESLLNIDTYLVNEIIDNIPSPEIKAHMINMKEPLISCFATILDNSVSTKYFNMRPCFFKGVDNIKILYQPSAAHYASSLTYIVTNIEGDEEKSSMKHSKMSKAFDEADKLPVNDPVKGLITLPLFWLKQLNDSAVTELTTAFTIDKAEFIKSHLTR